MRIPEAALCACLALAVPALSAAPTTAPAANAAVALKPMAAAPDSPAAPSAVAALADSTTRAPDTASALPSDSRAIVVSAQAIVHEKPDVLADALRLLYAGEIVNVLETVRDADQALWARISMGSAQGFVRQTDLRPGTYQVAREWRREPVLRDDRPLSFSFLLGAETFGGGMAIHYLPFSRLGFSFTVGSILDEGVMKGTALGLGALTYLALNDISPFVETGFTRLSYHEGKATLRVESFYLSLGVEWIFSSGIFVNAMVTYSRSADVEVAFNYDIAKSGGTQVPPDFGVLDPGDDETFQFVLPGFSLGYAF